MRANARFCARVGDCPDVAPSGDAEMVEEQAGDYATGQAAISLRTEGAPTATGAGRSSSGSITVTVCT